MITEDEQLEEAFIEQFENYTVERQKDFIRRLQHICWKQGGSRL